MFGPSWTRFFFIVLGEQQVLRRTNGEADPRGSLLYYSSEEVSPWTLRFLCSLHARAYEGFSG